MLFIIFNQNLIDNILITNTKFDGLLKLFSKEIKKKGSVTPWSINLGIIIVNFTVPAPFESSPGLE